jgi:hypothetical protein
MNCLSVEFFPSGRGKARCAPNPEYPHGVDIDLAGVADHCEAALPYPAPECGVMVVTCSLCQTSIAVTCAGRPDDPRNVKVRCKMPNPAHAQHAPTESTTESTK